MQVHEEVAVGVQDVIKTVQRMEALGSLVGGLGHEQVAHRSYDDGAHLGTSGLGLADLVGDGGVDVVEGGGGVDLGDQVVVVGVQPLGHLHGRTGALTAGQREIALDVESTIGIEQVTEAGRRGPQGGGHLKYLVVKSEVRWNRCGLSQPQVHQTRTSRPAQFGCGVLELVDAQVPLPEGLDGALELTVPSDAGVSQNGGPRQGCGGDL